MIPDLPAWAGQLLTNEILDWQGQDSRYLGESASRHYQDGPIDSVLCPYPGRSGQQMNSAAMATVLPCFPEVQALLHQDSGPTAGDAWRAVCRGRWRVLFEPLTPIRSAHFKTALGLYRPLTGWLLSTPDAASRPLQALVSTDALVGRLDTEGWLHGHHQVCAADPRRIEAAWDALSAPTRSADHPSDRAHLLVAATWIVLARTRSLLKQRTPLGWSPAGDVLAEWPLVLRMLRQPGPGALVSELPCFGPRWALHCFASPPTSLQRLLLDTAERDFDGLGRTYQAFVAALD